MGVENGDFNIKLTLHVPMPENCHMCGAYGISDCVGLDCPVEQGIEKFSYDGRPNGCPLREVVDNE